jgi:hypothetical protein
MRVLLTMAIVVAALVAVAAFALTQMVERADLREQVIRQAEAITGSTMVIEGQVDVNILPQPTFSFAAATLAPHGEGVEGLRLTADRIDLRVNPFPLLRGAVEVDHIRLVRPVLHLALDDVPELGGFGLAAGGLALPFAPHRFTRLTVIDGRTVVDGPHAGPQLERINLELVAEDERGPFTMVGDFASGGQLFEVDARLGRLTGETTTTMQLELTSHAPRQDALRIAFRGLLTHGGPRRLRGQMTLSGRDLRAGADALGAALGTDAEPLPDWLAQGYEIAGALDAGPEGAEVGELRVSIAGIEASGRLRLARTAGAPQLGLELAIPQLELPERPALDASPLDLLTRLSDTLDGEIDLTVQALAWRGEVTRRARITLDLAGAGSVAIERARAVLPGNADLGFAGRLIPVGEAVGIEGALTAVTDNLPLLLDWLEMPRPPPEGRQPGALSLATDLRLEPAALRLSDLELRIDTSQITGSAALDFLDHPRLAAALQVDRLDADAYWPGSDTGDFLGALGGWLGATDVALEAVIARLTWQGLRFDTVALDSRAVAGKLSLHEVRAQGVAQSEIELRGEIDFAAQRLRLDGSLESPRPALLARRLGWQPPIALARLTPLVVRASARGWQDAMTVEAALRLQEIDVELQGDLALEGGLSGFALQIEAGHPDYAALVRDLGQPGIQAAALSEREPFHLAAWLRRDEAVALGASGSVALGGSRVTGEFAWQEGAERPRLDARLSVGDVTLEALRPIAALAGLRPDPAVLAGPVLGNLPDDPLPLRLLAAVDGRIEVSGRGGLAGDRLELIATVENRRLMVERFTLPALGGRLEVEMVLDQDRPVPFAAIALTLDQVDPTALADHLGLAPVVRGTANLYTEATLTGRSPYELVRNLTGDLMVSVRDGTIVGLGPQPVPLASLEAQFDIRRGIAKARGVRLALPGGEARIEGVADLLLWVADLTVEVDPKAAGPEPGHRFKLVGPLDRLRALEPEAWAPAAP